MQAFAGWPIAQGVDTNRYLCWPECSGCILALSCTVHTIVSASDAVTSVHAGRIQHRSNKRNTLQKGRWTMSQINSARLSAQFCRLAVAVLFCLSSLLMAQTTLSTGSISGTVTDPSGAVVSDA